MHIVEPGRIFTVADIATLLQLTDSSPIDSAIKSGELPALQLGSDLRVVGKDLNDYLMALRSSNPASGANQNNRNGGSHLRLGTNLKLTKGAPFMHRWPDNTKEKFRDVLEGTVNTKTGVHGVRIGFTTRNAAGKARERGVVFVDDRPIVELCGADDFNKSNILVSVIKLSNKQVTPIQGVPKEYSHLQVDDYQKFVTGPYASSNLAVCCQKDDIETMVEHALLRLQDIQARKALR